MHHLFLLLALSTPCAVYAAHVVITVGGTDPLTVYDPPTAKAAVGDTVVFNFTQGNHTAIQSMFTSPCVPEHDTNITLNGFNSGPRDTVNGTAITQLEVLVQDAAPIWFFDANTCMQGGVGGINLDEDSGQTLGGARSNAIRFNGTNHTSTSSTQSMHATSSLRAAPTETTEASNDAQHNVVCAFGAVIPVVLAALLI